MRIPRTPCEVTPDLAGQIRLRTEEINAGVQRPQRIAEWNWLLTTHRPVVEFKTNILSVAAFIPFPLLCMNLV